VQNVLKKASQLEIKAICPLHGPTLKEDLSYYLSLYDKWSKYTPEEEGVVIAYTSIYGNTKKAVIKLADELRKNNHPNVVLYDLARCDITQAVSDSFRYSKLVLATTTYNMDIFPHIRNFIHHLVERNYQNRMVAFIENGSWAPNATKLMKELMSECKNITYTNSNVKIMSSLNDESRGVLMDLVNELTKEYSDEIIPSETNLKALSNISYGLYVVTCNDGLKDNGLIVNTVTQVSNQPNRFAVTINKGSYSCEVISKTKKMNVNCLSKDAPFEVFELFGFHSGRDINKFENINPLHSANGLTVLPKYINSYLSLEVIQTVDLGTHIMFICDLIESNVINDKESMSYSYYLNNVKPKPNTNGSKGYVCTVCGWVYEGDTLPEDIICPLCKHGAADFEKIM
jgi:flavin reductase (DIM6/NTAB) family NADH-FMN oxidoreductase RutF/flavodoxin